MRPRPCAVENAPCRSPCSLIDLKASMRPRPCAVENEADGSIPLSQDDASMRPRPSAVENLAGATAAASGRVERFNAATAFVAVENPRWPHGIRTARRPASMRPRPSMPWRTTCSGRPRRPGRRFNAATALCRGERLPRLSLDGDADVASMRPRPWPWRTPQAVAAAVQQASLQCGHGLDAVENRHDSVTPGPVCCASMRPRPSAVENAVRPQRRATSARWLQCGHGLVPWRTAIVTAAVNRWLVGFNAATALCRGEHDLQARRKRG